MSSMHATGSADLGRFASFMSSKHPFLGTTSVIKGLRSEQSQTGLNPLQSKNFRDFLVLQTSTDVSFVITV